MKNSKTFAAFVAIITIAFSVSLNADTDNINKTPAPKKEAPASSEKSDTLKAERKDGAVTVTWTLPAGEWRSVEIMRNDKASTRDRKRLTTVQLTATSYVDKTADANTNYWYWIKMTDKQGKGANIGPVLVK